MPTHNEPTQISVAGTVKYIDQQATNEAEAKESVAILARHINASENCFDLWNIAMSMPARFEVKKACAMQRVLCYAEKKVPPNTMSFCAAVYTAALYAFKIKDETDGDQEQLMSLLGTQDHRDLWANAHMGAGDHQLKDYLEMRHNQSMERPRDGIHAHRPPHNNSCSL